LIFVSPNSSRCPFMPFAKRGPRMCISSFIPWWHLYGPAFLKFWWRKIWKGCCRYLFSG
jgi:hypothetical protein